MGVLKVAMGVLLTLGLSGCGGGGDEPDNKVWSISEIEGFWNSTTTHEGEQDISYIQILNESGHGFVTEYDYLGDSYDKGDECYDKYPEDDQARTRIDSLGEGDFVLFQNRGGVFATSYASITKSSSGNTITIKYEDVFDEDGDGNTTELISETWTREIGATTSDYTPECVNGQAPAGTTQLYPTEFETDMETMVQAMGGLWRLGSQTITYSGGGSYVAEGGDIVGAMVVFNSTYSESITRNGYIDSEFSGTFAALDNNNLNVTDEGGCEQEVVTIMSKDHTKLYMGYAANQCGFTPRTENIWIRD